MVLPTLSHQAILELEDQAGLIIKAFARAFRGVGLNADYAVLIRKQVPQSGLEGPSCLLPEARANERVSSPALIDWSRC